MTTERRFCRFSRSPATAAFGVPEVPDDGLCLCAFLVLASAERPTRVLMGKLDPSAPWDHLGALDPERLEAWKDRWMLPSSHLLLREAPQAAAERILREMTPLAPRPLKGPQVASEVYAPERHPQAKEHWDLEFIFRASVSESELKAHPAWRELRFVETSTLTPAEVARAQGDILEHAGLRLAAKASPPGR